MISILNANVFFKVPVDHNADSDSVLLQIQRDDGDVMDVGSYHNEDGAQLKPGNILGVSCSLLFIEHELGKEFDFIKVTNARLIESGHPDFDFFAPNQTPELLDESNLQDYISHLRSQNKENQAIIINGNPAVDEYKAGLLDRSLIKNELSEFFFKDTPSRDAFLHGFQVGNTNAYISITDPEKLSELRDSVFKKSPKPS